MIRTGMIEDNRVVSGFFVKLNAAAGSLAKQSFGM
jgi:hypothetical protein